MAVEETFAHLSNDLVYSAMIVYTGAMIGYAYDFAKLGRRSIQVGETVGADLREPVAVASSARAAGAPTSSIRSSNDVPGVEARRAPGSAESRPPRSKAAGIAVSLTVLAAVLHGGSVLFRGLAAHRVPWGNMYEFTLAATLAVVVTYLVLLTRKDVRWLGLFVVTPVLLFLGLAVTVLYVNAGPLVPALKSYWLAIHVTAAMLSSGLFTVGFALTLLFLAVDRVDRRVDAGKTPGRLAPLAERLPNAANLDRLAYRINGFAFPLWTFAVIAGAIWAESAWGRYWGWDPKETWAFITWVSYACYLHARATIGWKGRRASVLCLIAYATFLFNFIGVNIFISGLHSYAGVG